MKIKLKTLVAQFNNSKQGSQHDFARLYNIARRGMRTFNRTVTGKRKSVLLDVSDHKTVLLPKDYVAYTKVGVVDAFGKIYTFKVNERLTDLRGSAQIGGTFTGVSDAIYANYNHGGDAYFLMGHALGTATIGEYRIDEDMGVILLDFNNPYSQIMLEYIPDGHDDDAQDYCLDDNAEECFICWLRWQNAIDLRKQFSQNDVREYKREFYREKRNARWRANPVRVYEFEQAARNSIKLVARA